MGQQTQKRNRAVVFTEQGFQKIQSKIRSHKRGKSREKLTFEELSEITGLAYSTVFRVLKRQQGVNKRTLAKFFFAFGLDLNSDDYTLFGSTSTRSRKRNITWINLSNTFDASRFYGREKELATIKQWLVEDRCRLVTIYGMGGTGKTSLSVKLVKEIEDKFDYVFWISLNKPLLLEEFLINLNQFLLDKHKFAKKSSNISQRFAELFNYLRLHRCLIVFDEIETIMQTGAYSGCYEEKYKNYRQLIRYMAEVSHKSSFLLISRELPKEASIFDGSTLPIKSIKLDTRRQFECLKIIDREQILGSDSLKKELIKVYGGNFFALIKAAKNIRENYDGNIYNFLCKDRHFCNDILFFWIAIIKDYHYLKNLSVKS